MVASCSRRTWVVSGSFRRVLRLLVVSPTMDGLLVSSTTLGMGLSKGTGPLCWLIETWEMVENVPWDEAVLMEPSSSLVDGVSANILIESVVAAALGL